MKKKILISTGGTGGHVVPATIFYEHLQNEFDVILISDDRGIKFLDKKKYNLEIFNVPRISRNILLLPFQIILLIYLTLKSFVFLKRKKIEILLSTGGYMSLPLCAASKILNIRLLLFEPNMVLGRSNKLFVNFCEKIFCYSNKIKNFPIKFKNKICLIPALLRREFYFVKATKDIDINEKINLLIIGGSQGARLFDNAIMDSIIYLSKKHKLKIYHQTSLTNLDKLKRFYLKNNIENELFNYNENVFNFMNKTNICITRAGASTLAELVFLNIPHIAIPLPSAKDNHQFENAQFYYDMGCNWVFNQNEIISYSLKEKLLNIIENKEDYLNKKSNMKNFNYENTWNNINQKITTIINEN